MKDYDKFVNLAKEILQDRVYTDYLLRYAYGLDASCYLYIPKVVVKVQNEDELIKILKIANTCNTPVTFRAAGTSLSGQGVSDSVLIIARDGFENYKISDNGNVISLEPGIIGGVANEYLSEFKKKIGPDPATIASAMVGGIVANNASGMCCGVSANSYHTIKSIRVVLCDGEILDTSDDESIKRFMLTHPEICDGLMKLKSEILADKELKDLITKKYKIKNTTGYGINSLIDFDNLKDILTHIFVGSEGTLGFISKIEYNCIDNKSDNFSGFLFFDKFQDASEVVVKLASLGSDVVIAAEMMDYHCMKAINSCSWEPEILKNLKEGTCSILMKSEANSSEELDKNLTKIKDALKDIKTIKKMEFTKDKDTQELWWRVRKQMFPIVAGARDPQSSVITEDLCFSMDEFCNGAKMIADMFKKHKFDKNGIIFGHALAGNLHFVITPDLNKKEDFDNFTNLIEEINQNVVKNNGSLKAEHGTGRMVAPFVELEWGKKAYEINKTIKKLFDPKTLLNPDVIITDDKEIYKKNLKAMSKIDDLYNKCIECGNCERNCPSKNLTLTPRMRISLLREMQRLESIGDIKTLEKLQKDYNYYGVDTCATCSMCSLLCPLEIDTANIALSIKRKMAHKTQNAAQKIYDNLGRCIKIAKFSLSSYNLGSKVISPNLISKVSEKIHNFITPSPYAPEIMPLPNYYKLSNKLIGGDKKIVYFTSCANRVWRPNNKASMNFDDKRSIQEVFEGICKKGKIDIIYPDDIKNLCCGLSFEDYEEIEIHNREKIANALLKASNNGEFDIVIDHSACFAHTLLHIAKDHKNLKVFDMAEFLYNNLNRFNIKKQNTSVIVHQQCEIKKVKKEKFIYEIAKICAERAVLIDSFSCCGFAGKKGFFTPELNLSATKNLAKEINFKVVSLGVSTSSTCEIGLFAQSKIPFVNICYLFDKCIS